MVAAPRRRFGAARCRPPDPRPRPCRCGPAPRSRGGAICAATPVAKGATIMAASTGYPAPRLAHAGPHARQGERRDDFYEGALRAGDRILYRQARAESGLEGEIALLRLHLYRLIQERSLAGDPDGEA